MTKPLLRAGAWARLLSVPLLVGCVAGQQGGLLVASHADEPAKVHGVPPPLPDVSLTEDLLYKFLVAEIAGQRGESKLAGERYLELAKATRDPRVAQRAAQIAFFAKDQQMALAALRLWVDLAPNSVEARQGLVVLLVRNGQADAALPHLEKLITLLPLPLPSPAQAAATPNGPEFITDQGYAFMFVASLLSREQDKQGALRLMKKLTEAHRDNPDAQLAHATLALGLADFQAARPALDQALKLKPGWGNAAALRARMLQMQGDNEGALNYLQATVKDHPKDLSLRLSYARLLVDAKRLAEAREQFTTIAQQMPGNPDVALSLGILSLQIKQPDDAERYLKQARQLGKYERETSYYLGQIAETRKDYGAAIGFYKTVDQGEAYLDAQLRVVGLMAKQGDTAGARTYLRKIKLQSPEQAKLITMAEADLLREEKHYAQAIEIYNIALQQAPADNDLLYGRAMLAEKINRLDLLEQDLGNILAREPKNARALNALGYTLADKTTRYPEALDYIKRALELSPQDGGILDSMGWVQFRLGNKAEALRYLKQALELTPEAEIAAHLGEVLWVTGDQDQARKIWQDALKTAPDDEVLQNTVKRFTP